MTFEEALKAMKAGKIVTDGLHELKLARIFKFRMIEDTAWTDIREFSPDEVLGDHWQIVEGKE